MPGTKEINHHIQISRDVDDSQHPPPAQREQQEQQQQPLHHNSQKLQVT